MPPAGFEPATPASDWPQILALDRSATGIGFDPRTVQPEASRYTDWAERCKAKPFCSFIYEWTTTTSAFGSCE